MPHKNANARSVRRTDHAEPAGAPATKDSVSATEKASDKVWRALRENPGATATEVAMAAGVGQSTATKALAQFAADGSAERRNNGTPRTADRWYPTDGPTHAQPAADESPADEPPIATEAAATDTTQVPVGQDDNATVATEQASDLTTHPSPPSKAPRLAKGALREMVLAELRRDPDRPLTPGTIAKRLRRSAGAVANALDTLGSQGHAIRVGDSPRTYLAAPPADHDPAQTNG